MMSRQKDGKPKSDKTAATRTLKEKRADKEAKRKKNRNEE